MPSGFFILLRFFLRVDDVLIRINDTRFHYEIENDYILKEYTSKEAPVSKLQHVSPSYHSHEECIEENNFFFVLDRYRRPYSLHPAKLRNICQYWSKQRTK